MSRVCGKLRVTSLRHSVADPDVLEEVEEDLELEGKKDARGVLVEVHAWDREGFEVGLSHRAEREASSILLSQDSQEKE